MLSKQDKSRYPSPQLHWADMIGCCKVLSVLFSLFSLCILTDANIWGPPRKHGHKFGGKSLINDGNALKLVDISRLKKPMRGPATSPNSTALTNYRILTNTDIKRQRYKEIKG